MALVTNDEDVFESQSDRKVADAGSLLDDTNPIVLNNPKAFRPVGPAADEGEGRTSAVMADPLLQSPDTAKGDPPLGHDGAPDQPATASTAPKPATPTSKP